MSESAISLERPKKQRLPRNVKVLGLASLFNDMASEMVFPLLPGFLLTVLHGNRFYLGLIEGLAETLASLLKLWSGWFSDQTRGRKGLILFGYTVPAFVRPLMSIITAPWQLLLIRLADRLGKGIRTSPRDALIVDSTPENSRGQAFGFHRAMDHLGAAIGPLLATVFLWLLPDHLRLLFLFTLIPGLLVLGCLVFGLREPPVAVQPLEHVHLSLQPLDRKYRFYLLALLIFTLGNASDTFLLVRAGELGVPLVLLPLLCCFFHIAKSYFNWVIGSAIDRRGPWIFLVGGWVLFIGVYLAFGLATTAWQAWIIFLVYALYYGLTEPSQKTLVAILAGQAGKGMAFGWYNCTIGIATLPASLLFGWLYQEQGAWVAFATGAVLALVALILLLGVWSMKNKPAFQEALN